MDIIHSQFIVYHIQNIKTGKRYIGCSKSYEKRWSEHKKKLNEGKHENRYLQRAWNKDGEENFDFTIDSSYDTKEEMFYWETEFIAKLTDLYNLAAGGKGGNTTKNFSKDDKEKLSKERSVRFIEEYAIGKRVAPMKKFDQYDEVKQAKLKQTWSDCKKGKANGRFKYTQGILQLDHEGIVKEWHDITEIREDGTFTAKYVLNCCNKKVGYDSHKGYKWRFKEE